MMIYFKIYHLAFKVFYTTTSSEKMRHRLIFFRKFQVFDLRQNIW